MTGGARACKAAATSSSTTWAYFTVVVIFEWLSIRWTSFRLPVSGPGAQGRSANDSESPDWSPE